MKKNSTVITIVLCLALCTCKKYLAEKPDAKLDVPSTLTDFQALLDRYSVMNTSDPGAGEVSADNYYLFNTDFLSLSTDQARNMYTWQPEPFVLQTNDWFYCYRPALTANTILEGLANVTLTSQNGAEFNNVKGEALFARGKAFLVAASLWAGAYDHTSASAQLGIPLRLSTDFNTPSRRGNLQETYSQIITDLSEAISLLPVTPLSPLRASKPAAYGMLARTYLDMGDYVNAGLYADSCLQLYNTLVDYNTLNSAANYPLAKFNAEVIEDSQLITETPINNVRARIDTLLYSSYAANDLRKTVFFKSSANGSHVFKGSYEGGVTLFAGIASDEMFLIRAECFARAGKTTQAMSDLNTLLSHRFLTGTFITYSASSSADALAQVLAERRKELVMRGLRWMDLKRLNLEGANVTLRRNINGETFTLPPNDPRYALPIPDDIIELTGMQQNPR